MKSIYLVSRINLITIILISIILFSCNRINSVKEFFSREPEVTACSEALKTALAISYSTSLTYAALEGNVNDNVQVLINTPSFIMCAITIDEAHPLPIGSADYGKILVAGIISDDSTAVMSVSFANIDIWEGTFKLGQATAVPVIRINDTLMTTYVSQDVNFYKDTANDPVFNQSLTQDQWQNAMNKFDNQPPTDTSVGIDAEQDVWLVKNTLTQTSNNTDGYTYNILGVGQYARCAPSEVSVLQFALFFTVVKPECRLNPISGYGILRELDVSNGSTGDLPELGTAVLLFEKTCDGKVRVPIATGNYIASSGKRFSLGL